MLCYSSECLRSWRNWHTRTFEGRVLNRVRVQVPSTAPPNNPNLDTRLGLLLFARKAAKHGAFALVPVALCPSGAVSGRAFWLYGRVWGNGKQLSRYPMPLSRYPIGPTRYPIEKCGQAVQKKLSTDIPQNCLYYPVLIYRTVSCISRREYASRTI